MWERFLLGVIARNGKGWECDSVLFSSERIVFRKCIRITCGGDTSGKLDMGTHIRTRSFLFRRCHISARAVSESECDNGLKIIPPTRYVSSTIRLVKVFPEKHLELRGKFIAQLSDCQLDIY